MKTMLCPMNGLRNINEFICAGPVDLDPTRFLHSDTEWATALFFQYNGLDNVLEWWQHSASGYWFIVERNRLTNDIKRSFDPEQIFSESIDYARLRASQDGGSHS